MPAINPDEENESPGGRLPDVSEYERGAVPPEDPIA
jgi:hypothetical protein